MTWIEWLVRFLGVGVMLLSLGAVSACSSDTTYLPALLADPMADYSHPSLTEEFRAESPKGRTLIPMAREDASVTTGFDLAGSADVVIEDVIATAESHGWTFDSHEPATNAEGTRGWLATKELAEGLATLSINLLGPGTADWDLSIALRFEEEY